MIGSLLSTQYTGRTLSIMSPKRLLVLDPGLHSIRGIRGTLAVKDGKLPQRELPYIEMTRYRDDMHWMVGKGDPSGARIRDEGTAFMDTYEYE